jgi:hypothetical protein
MWHHLDVVLLQRSCEYAKAACDAPGWLGELPVVSRRYPFQTCLQPLGPPNLGSNKLACHVWLGCTMRCWNSIHVVTNLHGAHKTNRWSLKFSDLHCLRINQGHSVEGGGGEVHGCKPSPPRWGGGRLSCDCVDSLVCS